MNSYTLKCSVCIPEEWTVDDILNAANVVLGDDMRMATGDRVSGLCLLSVTYYAFDEMAGETKARVLIDTLRHIGSIGAIVFAGNNFSRGLVDRKV